MSQSKSKEVCVGVLEFPSDRSENGLCCYSVLW